MTVWAITADEDNPCRGRLVGPGIDCPCALGKSGIIPQAEKSEGDGCTPLGTYPFRRVFYRADKIDAPETNLPCRPVTETDGWCDAPTHGKYNQLVELPFDASHEKLWREDDVYDLILVIGHNDNPPQAGKGSAIFIHVARENFEPTEGCAAFRLGDLREFLAQIEPDDLLQIR